jgi:Fe-S-cluster-containing dehydrogenase component/DMSO reductase anchor subunit
MGNASLTTQWLENSDQAASRTLIDDLLAEQRALTAVEAFSRAQDRSNLRSYRELLPATPPGPGQQYAFEVNLDLCSGCKACVSACHSLNGLDDAETWREVGLLIDAPHAQTRPGRTPRGFQQNITTACHHCIDPACLNGCPVLAYDKSPVTGVVHHLDDQCIGCQYCVMMCPYEVPQYSKQRGIVRKCDMCYSRLAAGEAPACAQACPTNAIRITVVEQSRVRAKYRPVPTLTQATPPEKATTRNSFLPVSPNPAITLPTTRFVTQRAFPENLFAGDHAIVRRADPHLPLVMLLVISQLAAGASAAAVFVRPDFPLLVIAACAGAAALGAGSFHLGQPLKAWRAFLGWRKSWFSREVIALSAFGMLVASALAAKWIPAGRVVEQSIVAGAAVAGLLTVASSSMVYVKTRREFWGPAQSFGKFFGTTSLLGAAAALAVVANGRIGGQGAVPTALLLVTITITKLAFERRSFQHLADESQARRTPLDRTAVLLAGELNGFVRARVALAVAGGVLFPLIGLLVGRANPQAFASLALLAFGLCVAGELLERYLFFTAVVPEKMPGGLAP